MLFYILLGIRGPPGIPGNPGQAGNASSIFMLGFICCYNSCYHVIVHFLVNRLRKDTI